MFLGLQYQGPIHVSLSLRLAYDSRAVWMKVFGPAKAAVTIRLGYLQARCNGLEEEEGNPGKQRFFDSSQLCSFCIRAPRLGFFPGRRCMRLRRRQGYPKKRCRADPKVEAVLVATCTAAPDEGFCMSYANTRRFIGVLLEHG